MSQFAKSIENLIQENRIKLALYLLADFLRLKDQEKYNRCLLLRSNLVQTEQDYSANILNQETAFQHLSKVRYGLITLLSEINQMTFDDDEAILRANQHYKSYHETEVLVQKPSRSSGYFIVVLTLLGLAGLGYFGYNIFSEKTQPVNGNLNLSVTEKIAKVNALYEESKRYSTQQEYKKAESLLDQAIEISNDNAKLYKERSDVRLMLEKTDLAYSDAQRAIILDPANGYPYATLAQIATFRNDTEGFYANIEKAMQKHVPVWEFTNAPGIVEHIREKRLQDLTEHYKKLKNNN